MALDRLPLALRLAVYGLALAVLLWLTEAPSRELPQIELWDKAEHALAWAMLAGSGLLLFPRWPWRIAALALAYGVLVEVLQGVLPFGRDPDWRDLVADAVGVGLALLIAAALRRVRR